MALTFSLCQTPKLTREQDSCAPVLLEFSAQPCSKVSFLVGAKLPSIHSPSSPQQQRNFDTPSTGTSCLVIFSIKNSNSKLSVDLNATQGSRRKQHNRSCPDHQLSLPCSADFRKAFDTIPRIKPTDYREATQIPQPLLTAIRSIDEEVQCLFITRMARLSLSSLPFV